MANTLEPELTNSAFQVRIHSSFPVCMAAPWHSQLQHRKEQCQHALVSQKLVLVLGTTVPWQSSSEF